VSKKAFLQNYMTGSPDDSLDDRYLVAVLKAMQVLQLVCEAPNRFR
jgi:hypothetical protein